MVAKLQVVMPGGGKGPAGGPGGSRDEVLAGMVRRMAGMGLNRTEVGVVVGMKATEVEAVYGADFMAGALETVANIRLLLYREATNPKKVNLSACRLFMKVHREHLMEEAKEVVAATYKKAKPPRAPAPKEPVLGKKAQAEADAKTVDKGTDWDGLLAS